MKKLLIEQLGDNTALLIELKKRFGDSELDGWWRKAIHDSRKLLKQAKPKFKK